MPIRVGKTGRNPLHAEVQAALVDLVDTPLASVTDDGGTYTLTFSPELTSTQMIELVEDYLATDEAGEARILRLATGALANNRAYLAKTSTTAAEDKAQLRTLTRQTNMLIRLATGFFDGTD